MSSRNITLFLAKQAVLRYLGSGTGFRQGGRIVGVGAESKGSSEGEGAPPSDLSPLGLTGETLVLNHTGKMVLRTPPGSRVYGPPRILQYLLNSAPFRDSMSAAARPMR
jgi:hypothetical protein